MTISGLVLTCRTVIDAHFLSELATDPRVEVGEVRGHRLALVLDTVDPVAGEDWVRQCAADPRVLDVAIAFIAPTE